MKSYELNYLVSGALEPEKAQGVALKIESLIQSQGGVLMGERKNKKTSFGYEIKGFHKGALSTIGFQIEPEKMTFLKEQLKKASQVLRFMILWQKPSKQATKPQKEIGKVKRQKKVQKVELKEIEQKLEELLED